MLNTALQGSHMLDAPLNGLQLSAAADGSVAAAGGARAGPGASPQMQMLLQAKLVENHALQQRVSDLEAVLQHQGSSGGTSVQQCNAIKKLQAQIVLLEEQYRLSSDRGSVDHQLLEHGGGLAQRSLSLSTDAESFALASGGGAALSPGSFSRGGSLASSVPHASAFAAAAAAAGSVGGAYALETSSSGGSSATAPGAAGGFLSSGGDSSTSPAGGSVPWGQHAAGLVGLNHHHAAPPAHLRAADGGFGLLQQQQQSAGGAELAHSPLPPTLSGLSRSLSLSAAAGVAHHQQQLRAHIGGSAGGMLVGDANSSSDKFVQDAEVWPTAMAARTQSLLSAREFGSSGAAAAMDSWRFNASSSGGGGLAAALSGAPPAAAGAAGSSSTYQGRTAPQAILGNTAGSQGGHGAGSMAAASAAAAAAAAAAAGPWSATTTAATTPAGLGPHGALNSSFSAFSPASPWEHPMGSRQGSTAALDPYAQHPAAQLSEYHSLLAAAAAQLDPSAIAAAAAASAHAGAAALQGVHSDRFSHDSNLAGLLPYELNKLVTEGSLGSLSGGLQQQQAQQQSGLLAGSLGSLDDLQQAIMARHLAAAAAAAQGQQQHHLHHQQHHPAAAAAAAAAAAVAAMQQGQQASYNAAIAAAAAAAAAGGASNATVRGGKPLQHLGLPTGKAVSSGGARIPIPMPSGRSFGGGSLSSSRSQQGLARAASGPVSSAYLDAGDDGSAAAGLFGGLNPAELAFGARGQSEVVFARGGGSSLGQQGGLLSMAVEQAEATAERERRAAAAVVRKWSDNWGPECGGPEAAGSPRERDASMSRSAPGGSSGLAAMLGSSGPGPDLPDTTDQDLPDQDGAFAALRHGSGSSVGLVALGRAGSCTLTRSSSAALGASADAGCDADGQELDAGAQNARLRSKQDAAPNTCVYVGFLGSWVSEKDLTEYFAPYGELISVRLLISKKSRRSREQAFVEFARVEQAQRAITWLDSIDYPGLVKQLGCGGLVVRFADRKKPAFDA